MDVVALHLLDLSITIVFVHVWHFCCPPSSIVMVICLSGKGHSVGRGQGLHTKKNLHDNAGFSIFLIMFGLHEKNYHRDSNTGRDTYDIVFAPQIPRETDSR